MPFELTDQSKASLGIFGTEDEAKEFVPDVKEWRRGEDGIPGWYGFLSTEPFTTWDYRITLIPGGRGGFVRDDNDKQAAIARQLEQAPA